MEKAPARIDNKLLEGYPAFVERRKLTERSPNNETEHESRGEPVLTPEERIGRDHRLLVQELERDVLDRIRNASPAFFERVVMDLLVAMGNGRPEMGEVMGRPGDGLIENHSSTTHLGLRFRIEARAGVTQSGE